MADLKDNFEKKIWLYIDDPDSFWNGRDQNNFPRSIDMVRISTNQSDDCEREIKEYRLETGIIYDMINDINDDPKLENFKKASIMNSPLNSHEKYSKNQIEILKKIRDMYFKKLDPNVCQDFLMLYPFFPQLISVFTIPKAVDTKLSISTIMIRVDNGDAYKYVQNKNFPNRYMVTRKDSMEVVEEKISQKKRVAQTLTKAILDKEEIKEDEELFIRIDVDDSDYQNNCERSYRMMIMIGKCIYKILEQNPNETYKLLQLTKNYLGMITTEMDALMNNETFIKNKDISPEKVNSIIDTYTMSLWTKLQAWDTYKKADEDANFIFLTTFQTEINDSVYICAKDICKVFGISNDNIKRFNF